MLRPTLLQMHLIRISVRFDQRSILRRKDNLLQTSTMWPACLKAMAAESPPIPAPVMIIFNGWAFIVDLISKKFSPRDRRIARGKFKHYDTHRYRTSQQLAGFTGGTSFDRTLPEPNGGFVLASPCSGAPPDRMSCLLAPVNGESHLT